MARIGVFVCHCGTNIAKTVDVKRVAEEVGKLPDVVYSTDLQYACSKLGQGAIEEAIREHQLDRVVVASCTPRMHEVTFQRCIERAGLNKYMLEMTNIREQCSWVIEERERATEKAIEIIRMAVGKSRRLFPLKESYFPVEKTALVIGGGIAGMQAALDIARSGYKVILVEKSPSIGGRMAQLEKTFPTLDCAA